MRNTAILAAAAILATLAGPVTAEDEGNDLVTVRDTDFKGRPPFKRSIERLPAAEVARLEQAQQIEGGDELVTVRQVDFRGKPPFARSTETLTVADVARLEALPEDGYVNPRFKRHGFKRHAR